MDKENKPTSLVFTSKSSNSSLEPSFPEYSFEALPSEEVRAIRAKTDVTGVYHGGSKRGYGLTPKEGDYFTIGVWGWEEEPFSPEFYERLAGEIEIKLNREGLTIILF